MMATRGMNGPGDDEMSLILDVGDASCLRTCLNQSLDSREMTEDSNTQWVYKDALGRIRKALTEAERADTKPRTHLRLVRPAWGKDLAVKPLATKEDVESALDQMDAIFAQRGLTEEDRDAAWQAIAAFCMHQLENKRGPFYEAARRMLRS